jgi:hypothetical protein
MSKASTTSSKYCACSKSLLAAVPTRTAVHSDLLPDLLSAPTDHPRGSTATSRGAAMKLTHADGPRQARVSQKPSEYVPSAAEAPAPALLSAHAALRVLSTYDTPSGVESPLTSRCACGATACVRRRPWPRAPSRAAKHTAAVNHASMYAVQVVCAPCCRGFSKHLNDRRGAARDVARTDAREQRCCQVCIV